MMLIKATNKGRGKKCWLNAERILDIYDNDNEINVYVNTTTIPHYTIDRYTFNLLREHSTHRQNNDTISRQAAMEAFCDDCAGLKPGQCEHWDKCKSQNVLRSLPPSERESEWIPVSERLPEVWESVLASVHEDYAEHAVIINRYEEQPSWSNGMITAWQPLPEPYKGGDTE